MKKKILSMAMMGAILCFGFSSQAQADTIMFDEDGAGPNAAFEVDVFDWLPSSALAVGSVPVAQGNTFTLYTHASLSNFTLAGTAVGGTGLGTDYELTFVAGFGEEVVNVGAGFPGNASFVYDPNNPVNFFEIYSDVSLNSDNSLADGTPSGTGFNDGTLILSGRVTESMDTFTVFTADVGPLDNFGPDEFSTEVGQVPTNTVGGVGGGSTDIVATVAFDFIDPNYFPDITNLSLAGYQINFNTSFITAFNEVDPATQLWDGAGYVTPNVGALNGITGPDFLFQVDANQSFQPVPEPATMLLFGTGLIGLAGFARRKRSNK